MIRKRGKFSVEEDTLILAGINNGDIDQVIFDNLVNSGYIRNIPTVLRRINHIRIMSGIKKSVDDTKEFRDELHSKEYWPDLKQQFTADELRYFEAMWVQMQQQFRGDVLPSEEMQLKQLITVDILIKRGLIDRKKHIEEADKLENEINKEYDKPEDQRDIAKLSQKEQQLSYIKNAVMAYTAEYDKLLNRQKEILKDLKGNRDARIKRIEDSKSSWAGLMRALDDEELRSRMGDDMELMRLAKDKRAEELSQWHVYADGKADQPLLNADTVKDDDDYETGENNE
jgi:hypothetical protein